MTAHRALERDVDPSESGHKHRALALFACFPSFFKILGIKELCLVMYLMTVFGSLRRFVGARKRRKYFTAAPEASRIENDDQRHDDNIQEDAKNRNRI